jgi:hypothetical protein
MTNQNNIAFVDSFNDIDDAAWFMFCGGTVLCSSDGETELSRLEVIRYFEEAEDVRDEEMDFPGGFW